MRGSVPAALSGFLIVPTNRRSKDRSRFARWHDSQTDLIRLDLTPGRPGRVRTRVLPVDPAGVDLPRPAAVAASDRRLTETANGGYATQPNHGVNVAGNTLWATNLLFGAPLEVDLAAWKPRRVLRYLELSEAAPRVSGTSHFAWSLDHRFAYFHQSLLERERDGSPVRAADLSLVELDVATGAERVWRLRPPPDDPAMETANFHSGFFFEEGGCRYVGLLRTGALLESLEPHSAPLDHAVLPAPASTIWIVQLDPQANDLQAELLPGVKELDGLALSHLDVDASGGDGFVLYANFKEADVAENYGLVVRYERRGGRTSVRTFARPYDPGRTSLGHSWLPINIQLDSARRRLFCSFSGFRPRLLPEHIARAYPARVVEPPTAGFVPPALIRFDAETLELDSNGSGRGHVAYAEPMAMTVAGDGDSDYVCTFSPEVGLRVYDADDLDRLVFRAESPRLMSWGDTHFRPEPAHISFVPA